MSAGVWSCDVALAHFNGDVSLLREVVGLLLEALEQSFDSACRFAQSDDFVGLRRLTHSFLPSLRMLGLESAARVFEAFEASVFAQDEEGCARLAAQVVSQWPQVLAVLRGFAA